MEIFLTEENGTWKVPFESVFSQEDREKMEYIERLRFIDLDRIARNGFCGLNTQFESARYDDDFLYLNVHDSYPMILRFLYREKKQPDSYEWYAVHHRGNGLVVFDEIHCFKVSVERSGLEEPVLWA